MQLFKYLLYPLSWIYGMAVAFRNHLYDIGYKRSIKFTVPVISVGNITVGGTGKSPMVEYLIRLLRENYKIATLSRGYGRSTKGIRIVNEEESSVTVGDEPWQFFTKFSPEVKITVGEQRAEAIPFILAEYPEIQVIILDDAYQHRRVLPSLNILLMDYNRPFYLDKWLPSGNLRESPKAARRADIIVVTKCPDNLNEVERDEIIDQLEKYCGPDTPIFFAGLRYLRPAPVFKDALPDTRNVILITGIAYSSPLVEYLDREFSLLKHLEYPDHHYFTKDDADKIASVVQHFKDQEPMIITTEKDRTRLVENKIEPLLYDLPVFFIPVEHYFLKDGEKFDELVIESVENFG